MQPFPVSPNDPVPGVQLPSPYPHEVPPPMPLHQPAEQPIHRPLPEQPIHRPVPEQPTHTPLHEIPGPPVPDVSRARRTAE